MSEAVYAVGVEEGLTRPEAETEILNVLLDRVQDLGVTDENGLPCRVAVTVELIEEEEDRPALLRRPTEAEKGELVEFLRQDGWGRFEGVADMVEQASLAVFPRYITDGPGYAGRVLVVVWSGSPGFVQSYCWDKLGRLRLEGDYKE